MRRINAIRFALVALLALTVFIVLPAQTQTFTVLHNFTGGSDGAMPWALTIDRSGNFYGTALQGGGMVAVAVS